MTAERFHLDAHVHVHAEHASDALFDAASNNFASKAADPDLPHVLALTQTARARSHGMPGPIFATSTWSSTTLEAGASARYDHPTGRSLFVIAGHQIITRERIEVLALACTAAPDEGHTADETVAAVQRAGGIAVLPWGFGKWMGARGKIVSTLIEAARPAGLCLGENAGRPIGWPRPTQFKRAASKALPILPGTDPLALPGHLRRPASFGCTIDRPFDSDRPAASLKAALADLRTQPQAFGRRCSPLRFALDQSALRIRKALGRGGVA